MGAFLFCVGFIIFVLACVYLGSGKPTNGDGSPKDYWGGGG